MEINEDYLKHCTEIDIGDDVITLNGSGMSIYSPEFFNQALDKGTIVQIIGNHEGYM